MFTLPRDTSEARGCRMVFQPRFSLSWKAPRWCRAKREAERTVPRCRIAGRFSLSLVERINGWCARRSRTGGGPRRDAERRGDKRRERKEGLGKNLQGARYSNTALTIYTPVFTARPRAGGSLRSFRNASSRRESTQVFRVRDVRDCAMGFNVSSMVSIWWSRYM